jgi:hypothetical protein
MEDIRMLRFRRTREKDSFRGNELLIVAAIFAVVFACGSVYAKVPQKTFSSPEKAVEAMVDAVKADDTQSLLTIFGPGSRHIILSGDPVEDKQGREWFVKHYEEKNRLEEASGKVTLHVGSDEWPFPIPIVKAGNRWRFDTRAGKQEILARRVGRNELNAIQVCLAYVDAQREYAMKKAHQGEGLLEYAQKFVSTPGKQDGLYWEAGEGQEESPIGPLFAAARDEGYGGEPLEGEPYHGYFYRILTAQGKNAPGGAQAYVVGGKMIGGFALIAYPAHYRASGVMTFLVNHDGVVYQKDFGKKTKKAAQAMKAFDPDKTWTQCPSEDSAGLHRFVRS